MIDICNSTWQLDVDLLQKWLKNNTSTKSINGKLVNNRKLNRKKKIGAIMPVYVLGGFVDIDKLLKISSDFGIPIIEDSTEALGSFKNGKHAGTFGLTGVLSFNGNKIISTGWRNDLTNDKDIAKRAKHITTTAKTDPLDYFHDEIGYNYRLVNVLAAIGVAQMENFENILKRKKEIDALYRKELKGVGDIKFQNNDPNSNPNCWLFTFQTKNERDIRLLK